MADDLDVPPHPQSALVIPQGLSPIERVKAAPISTGLAGAIVVFYLAGMFVKRGMFLKRGVVVAVMCVIPLLLPSSEGGFGVLSKRVLQKSRHIPDAHRSHHLRTARLDEKTRQLQVPVLTSPMKSRVIHVVHRPHQLCAARLDEKTRHLQVPIPTCIVKSRPIRVVPRPHQLRAARLDEKTRHLTVYTG